VAVIRPCHNCTVTHREDLPDDAAVGIADEPLSRRHGQAVRVRNKYRPMRPVIMHPKRG